MISFTKQHEFAEGDRVFIERSSAATMAHFALNRGKFECPCKWKRVIGIVTDVKGNYVYCKHEESPNRISAFLYKDLRLVED